MEAQLFPVKIYTGRDKRVKFIILNGSDVMGPDLAWIGPVIIITVVNMNSIYQHHKTHDPVVNEVTNFQPYLHKAPPPHFFHLSLHLHFVPYLYDLICCGTQGIAPPLREI